MGFTTASFFNQKASKEEMEAVLKMVAALLKDRS